MDSGITPMFSIKYAIRYVITRVFPLPAPARMSTGPSMVSTALRCCGLSWSRKDKVWESSKISFLDFTVIRRHSFPFETHVGSIVTFNRYNSRKT